ncbi:MAG: propionyl-CoA synthetase [Gammaproteobacteria bacterium]|nr:propionyl-CoA synthetase [Gammaproteobacteria bacterium]
MTTYSATHRASIENPEEFWAKAAEGIDWDKRWDSVLDNPDPMTYRWFTGGRLNTCYNALDRHVERGRGDQAAIIYDSAVTDSKRTISYSDLLSEVASFAGVLAAQGVNKGDRVIVYMPMIPEAIVAVLACARLGAVHSVVFGGFAANELATRIDDAKPKAIVSASCGIEPSRLVEYKPLLDEAIELSSHKPSHCVIFQRPQVAASMIAGRDVDWNEAMAQAEPHGCVSVAATDPLYLLYTSGTTGQPKGIVRDNGGHAVALHWSMKNIYEVDPGEVYWAASDIGWVVGHSYIIYGPLLHGNTTVLFEGKPVGTPDAGAFWRVVAEHKVATMFTAPTAFRAIKQQDPDGKLIQNYDLSSLRTLFLAGERCDPDTLHWAENKLGIPVIDHWWQTETGWAIAANCVGIERLRVKAGSVGPAAPGWDVRALHSNGEEVEPGEPGAIACKLPLPPGSLTGLWQAEDRFRSSYLETFPGYYETGDAGFIDADGYVNVMSRTDDVINVAGHRLSTGSLEEVLAGHSDVAECAVIGAADKLKGQLPVGFLVLKAGVDRDRSEIVREAVSLVREQVGPVAAFKNAIVVDRLPKTRSGKILRGTMRKIADSEEYNMPATIEDPAVLEEIQGALGTIGFAK